MMGLTKLSSHRRSKEAIPASSLMVIYDALVNLYTLLTLS